MYIRLKVFVYYTVTVFGLFKYKFNKHKALLNLKGLIDLCTPNLVCTPILSLYIKLHVL